MQINYHFATPVKAMYTFFVRKNLTVTCFFFLQLITPPPTVLMAFCRKLHTKNFEILTSLQGTDV